MKHPTSHITPNSAVLLLSLIVFQGMGWFLAWQGLQWQAKTAAQYALLNQPTPDRETTLARYYFQQIKVGKKEIRLDGNLYDIRSIALEGDSVKLLLYHDKHEQALYSVLGMHFSQLEPLLANSPSKPLAVWVAQWLSITFILPPASSILLASTAQEKVSFSWAFPLSEEVDAPLFTPPRCVFEIV